MSIYWGIALALFIGISLLYLIINNNKSQNELDLK
jgi:hypothetical protein